MSKLKVGCLGIIGICLAIGLIGSCAGGGSKDTKQETSSSSASSGSQDQQKVYKDADINTLIKEAKENAAAANQNYKKENVRILGGKISNIDSDVKYITLHGTDKNYSMIDVSCHVDKNNKDLKDSILKLRNGQAVTVYGTVTEVGDLMGYKVKLDKVEPVE